MIEQFLNDLEKRISDNVELTLLDQWINFNNNRCTMEYFSPVRPQPVLPGIDWNRILINDTYANIELAMLRELDYSCNKVLSAGSGALLTIRPNYGTGTLTSAFGAEMFFLDDELDTLAITKPVDEEKLKKIISAGVPALHSGLMGRVWETADYMKEQLARFPLCSKHIHIYHPDFQGPMDIAELLYGSGIFTDLYFQPELIKDLLCLATETYITFLKHWLKRFPDSSGYSFHWGMMHHGHTMLRDDSAMNLPPEIIDEFILIYNQRILDEFGGGAIHFCGRGVHFIESFSQLRGVSAFNLTQPEYNDDMETIYRNTVDKNIKLIGLFHGAVTDAVSRCRPLRGQVHDQGSNPSFDKRVR